ncbi:hypothetical protein [Labrys wisconsinensis]|uniref:Uncharacterized protein n=1 Tax=Labrys wisconsinensis TaxID=425677 RepID=A0ABU0JQF9_9HYPH|nr:hypothetical protein [Labrys wisconsinensis]MDQ0475382.1 hypothetical protein [Labrys wisconsinensis]
MIDKVEHRVPRVIDLIDHRVSSVIDKVDHRRVIGLPVIASPA